MRKVFLVLFFLMLTFIYIDNIAYANIAPLKVKADGVEPMDNPGINIESAEITVSPDTQNNFFRFNCNYTIKALQDVEALTLGIPGDLGYTLEAGYIENMTVIVNGRPIKHKIYNTTSNLPEKWQNYNSQLHFKWHTITIPVKKDSVTKISVSYNIFWRILEQNKNIPYHIVPMLLSIDKLMGNTAGTYKIKFVNDDIISLPDVKVMINSMLEPNIISPAVLSPKWGNSEIVWEFKNPGEFQDFRLIVLSFRKLAMDFTKGTKLQGTPTEDSIKWALLNSNLERLAAVFEDIARKNIPSELDNNTLGTAAYLSSEFYFRQKNYYKALEMLSLPYKTSLWPTSIKSQYINSVNLLDQKNYRMALAELRRLHQYKDYVLLSNFADSQLEPVTEILRKQLEEKRNEEPPKPVVVPEEKKVEKVEEKDPFYWHPTFFASLLIIMIAIYKSKRNG